MQSSMVSKPPTLHTFRAQTAHARRHARCVSTRVGRVLPCVGMFAYMRGLHASARGMGAGPRGLFGRMRVDVGPHAWGTACRAWAA